MHQNIKLQSHWLDNEMNINNPVNQKYHEIGLIATTIYSCQSTVFEVNVTAQKEHRNEHNHYITCHCTEENGTDFQKSYTV